MQRPDPVDEEAWRRFLAIHDHFIVRHPPIAVAFGLAAALWLPSERGFFLAWSAVFSALTLWVILRGRAARARLASLAERCAIYHWHFACFGLLMGASVIWGAGGPQRFGSALPALASVAVCAMLMPTMIPARGSYALMTASALALPGLWMLQFGFSSAILGALMVLFAAFFVDQQRRLTADQLGHIRTEMERRRLLEALQRQSNERTRLIAALAHDLRQPVNAQRLALTALLRRHPKEGPTLGLLLGNTETLAAEVDALLDLGRSASGGLIPKPRPVQPEALLRLLLKGYDAETRARAIKLTGSYAGPLECLLDPAYLRRILGNLIENGLRHARGRMDVSLSARGGRLRLRVSDDGDGIPQGLRRRLFEPYVSRSADDLPHWGLGLYSARELARAHGGDLRLLPKAKGTAFEASLLSAPSRARRAVPAPAP